MPRLRTIVALLGGGLVGLMSGFVPSELIAWLRDRAAEGDRGAGDEPSADRHRRARKRRRRSRT